jgi:hypothetical protein
MPLERINSASLRRKAASSSSSLSSQKGGLRADGVPRLSKALLDNFPIEWVENGFNFRVLERT